jgi:glutamate--cysteine ligase
MHAVSRRLDQTMLLADLRDRAFAPSSGPVQVGLEVEMLAVRENRAVPLAELLEAMEPLFSLGEMTDITPTGGLQTYAYGPMHLTFEPGGQIEIVSPPRTSVDQALDDIRKVELLLERVLPWRGIRLVGFGLNPWQTEDEIELQTPLPRYQAMERYFSGLGRDGLRMMRLSCALQINVDTGSGSVADERWRLANLMSPVLAGMFANSPFMGNRPSGWKSTRSLVWRGVDPSRTGCLLAPTGPEAYLDFAVNAGLMVRRAPDGYRSGRPGFTFGDWLEHADDIGYPELDDWRYHLTTLFPEVRPRGSFELRSIDSPPAESRSVPVAVATALLVDDDARQRGIASLEPYAHGLDDLAVTCATFGPAHPLVGKLSCELLGLALESFERLPRDFISSAVVSDVQRFVDRYTARGRCPADDPIDQVP